MHAPSALRPLRALHSQAAGRCSRSWRCSAPSAGGVRWHGSPLRLAVEQVRLSSSSQSPEAALQVVLSGSSSKPLAIPRQASVGASSSKPPEVAQKATPSAKTTSPPEPSPTPAALLESAVRQLMQVHIDEAELQVQRLHEDVKAQTIALVASSAKEVIRRDLSDALAPHLEKTTQSMRKDILKEVGDRLDSAPRKIAEQAEAKVDGALASITTELRAKPSLDELNKILAAELEKFLLPVKEELKSRTQTLESVARQVRELEAKRSPEMVSAQVTEAVADLSKKLKSEVQASQDIREAPLSQGDESMPAALTKNLESKVNAQEALMSDMEGRIREDLAKKLAAADLSKALEDQISDDSSALAKGLAGRLTKSAAEQMIDAKVQEAVVPLQEALRTKLGSEEVKALVAEEVQSAIQPLLDELRAKPQVEEVQTQALVVSERTDLVPKEVPKSEKAFRSPLASIGTIVMWLLGGVGFILVALVGLGHLLPKRPKSGSAAARPSSAVQGEK